MSAEAAAVVASATATAMIVKVSSGLSIFIYDNPAILFKLATTAILIISLTAMFLAANCVVKVSTTC